MITETIKQMKNKPIIAFLGSEISALVQHIEYKTKSRFLLKLHIAINR